MGSMGRLRAELAKERKTWFSDRPAAMALLCFASMSIPFYFLVSHARHFPLNPLATTLLFGAVGAISQYSMG